MKTLGFIGTGGMGSPMAANLIKAGFKLVVNDIRREATKALESQGAEYRENARAVAESSEVVLSMLPYNEAVREVGLGKGGLHEARSGAKIWIDLSSIDKQTIVEVGRDLTAQGWQILDASVGGVEEQAAAGALSIWVSGPKALFEQALPLLRPMGKTILHVGETGSAKLVKNAMAMFAAVQHMALTEIFFWLKKGGLAEEAFQQILANSQQRSEALERILQVLISRRFKPRKSWMPKDVGFGLDMARQMETPVPLAALSYQLFAVAQAAGLDGYEATGIAYHVYELINGGKAKGA